MEDAARSGARTAVEDAISAMTRKNPWPVEFFFDEVWVSDSADATHEEHLIGGGEIDGDGELLVANRWGA